MASLRITLGTYGRGGTMINSYCEGDYVRGGLREALNDARRAVRDGRPRWAFAREWGICVAVFSIDMTKPSRVVARFPWGEGGDNAEA